MKNRHHFLYILLVGMALSFSSCEKDDICPDSAPGTPDAQMKFYSIVEGRETETSCNGIEFFGLDSEDNPLSSLPPQGNGLSIYLPLDFEDDESNFLLRRTISNTDPATNVTTTTVLTDTISIQYTPTLSFISKACGYRFVYDNMTISATTSQIIDDILPVIEDSPAEGHLLSSSQVCAKIYLKSL